MEASALAYEEPSIETILIYGSFILLLNLLNWILDATLYCGLVGQILVGVAWGSPGARLLTVDAERFIVEIGYLGLLLLVYEGGLSTSFSSLRANASLAICVAATGIAIPISLSFLLLPLVNGTTKLAAFAAGAALCSTSLGTAFTVLRTTGLASTRLGVVLSGAAMLDDVVGLVMVQVVAALGSSSSSTSSSTISSTIIIRPILVSLALVLVAVVSCRFVVLPATQALNQWRVTHKNSPWSRLFQKRSATALVFHTTLLIALVSGASYAGTSNLFAAYLSGAIVSWWDSEVPHCKDEADERSVSEAGHDRFGEVIISGPAIYAQYYEPASKWLLQPFFFASVGFSIPISKMFAGEIVWKGIVYAALMALGKLVCGLWLVRIPSLGNWRSKPNPSKKRAKETTGENGPKESGVRDTATRVVNSEETQAEQEQGEETEGPAAVADQIPDPADTDTQQPQPSGQANSKTETHPHPQRPRSLYPAAILGTAMVPRGEIGFLISAVAQSHGVFGQVRQEDGGYSSVFLIATWGIVLCTVLSPPCVGLLVRRVKRLESEASATSGGAPRRDILGPWGLQDTDAVSDTPMP